MAGKSKPIACLHGQVKTPPMFLEAKRETGFLLRRLQQGETLSMPASRPMPTIGRRCHELRIADENRIWRVIYRIDADAILVVEVFQKTTNRTPGQVIERCKRRLVEYDRVKGE